MELILWRHAEAEAGEPDDARPLTAKGRKQALKMGEWLDRNLPDKCRILASPARRTVQTAEALGRAFKTHAAIGTDTTPEKILAAANWPNSRDPVLIVGHQPSLGQVAALLIAGTKQDWTIRKSSVFWIASKASGEADAIYVKAVLGADLIGK
jgi:phosphohistidine phosphatase